MWEYRNGQWFNGPTPSPVGPPIGAAFWITDAAGNRDFRTFDGTNAPAATEVIPVNPLLKGVRPPVTGVLSPEEAARQKAARMANIEAGNVPRNPDPWLERPAPPYGNDDIAINKTPPLVLILQERNSLTPAQQAIWDADPKNIERIAVARRMEAGLPPNPVTPPQPVTNLPPANPFVLKPKPQGIPGYTPPMTTSGGPLNQDRTSIFTPPSVTEPKQVNFTTQDMFGIDPNPTPLMQRFRGDESFSNPTGQILTNAAGNTFDRNLLASIAEAVNSTNPMESARARAVMGAVQNPAIVANYRGPVTRDGPTDLISLAGAQFDQERELARLKTERAAWQAGDVENMNYRARSAWEAGHPQPVEGETEGQKVARESRDKGPNNPFRRMSRMSEGTMGDNPFMRRYPDGSSSEQQYVAMVNQMRANRTSGGAWPPPSFAVWEARNNQRTTGPMLSGTDPAVEQQYVAMVNQMRNNRAAGGAWPPPSLDHWVAMQNQSPQPPRPSVGRSVGISQATAARDQAVMNAATRPNAYSSADIARVAAATQQAVQNAAMYPPPPPVTGAPRRSVAPVGSMYANNALPLNPFVRGTTTAANPFVNRYAEGTWDPDWYNKAKAIGDPKARNRYLAEQNALKSQLTRVEQQRMARKPVIPAPVTTPVDWEALIKQKLDSGTLTHEDARAVHAAGNERLAQAITIKLTGGPWNYAWTPATPPPTATTKPAVNPQVIWYDGDVWKNLPTLNALNNTQQINPFSRLGMRSSYDPATETTIQAPEKMNAFTMMQIDRDPVQKDLMDSIYNRHGRSWEKEYADAVRAAPMGNATSYVKTG